MGYWAPGGQTTTTSGANTAYQQGGIGGLNTYTSNPSNTNPTPVVATPTPASALGLTDQTYIKATQPIVTSDTLTKTEDIPFVSLKEEPVFDVTKLNSDLVDTAGNAKMTAEEQRAQTMSDKLIEINNSLLGKEAFKKQKEQEAGIVDLTKNQNDLSTQLQILKNEAAAIPLQLEQEATGRGITTALLGRQENSRLRTNAIAALGVSSLLESSRGNLETALMLVDRAVEAEFGPLEAEQKALAANLDIITSSPKYSLEIKNRALQQEEIQKQKDVAIADAKNNKEQVLKIANELAANGNIALAQKAMKATTAQDALIIAAQGGVSGQAQDLEKQGYKYVTSPLERKKLEDTKQYEFTTLNGRTYARPIEVVKTTVKGGGGGGSVKVTKAQSQGKSGWTAKMADENYQQYIDGGYTPQEAVQRTKELSGFVPKKAQWDISRQFVADNVGADPQKIKSYLLENTDLTATEINSLIPIAGKKKEQTNIELLQENKTAGVDRVAAKSAGFTDEELNQVYGEETPWWKFW